MNLTIAIRLSGDNPVLQAAGMPAISSVNGEEAAFSLHLPEMDGPVELDGAATETIAAELPAAASPGNSLPLPPGNSLPLLPSALLEGLKAATQGAPATPDATSGPSASAVPAATLPATGERLTPQLPLENVELPENRQLQQPAVETARGPASGLPRAMEPLEIELAVAPQLQRAAPKIAGPNPGPIPGPIFGPTGIALPVAPGDVPLPSQPAAQNPLALLAQEDGQPPADHQPEGEQRDRKGKSAQPVSPATASSATASSATASISMASLSLDSSSATSPSTANPSSASPAGTSPNATLAPASAPVAAVPPVAVPQAMAPQATDAAPAFKPAVTETGPQEFETIVQRLAEAREIARPAQADLHLLHREFGHVAMQLEMAGRQLRVSLASADADFAPAVQAALAERAPGQGADVARSENAAGRGDQPAHHSSQNAAHQGSQNPGGGPAAQSGNGRDGGSGPNGRPGEPTPKGQGGESRDRAGRRDAGLYA